MSSFGLGLVLWVFQSWCTTGVCWVLFGAPDHSACVNGEHVDESLLFFTLTLQASCPWLVLVNPSIFGSFGKCSAAADCFVFNLDPRLMLLQILGMAVLRLSINKNHFFHYKSVDQFLSVVGDLCNHFFVGCVVFCNFTFHTIFSHLWPGCCVFWSCLKFLCVCSRLHLHLMLWNVLMIFSSSDAFRWSTGVVNCLTLFAASLARWWSIVFKLSYLVVSILRICIASWYGSSSGLAVLLLLVVAVATGVNTTSNAVPGVSTGGAWATGTTWGASFFYIGVHNCVVCLLVATLLLFCLFDMLSSGIVMNWSLACLFGFCRHVTYQ